MAAARSAPCGGPSRLARRLARRAAAASGADADGGGGGVEGRLAPALRHLAGDLLLAVRALPGATPVLLGEGLGAAAAPDGALVLENVVTRSAVFRKAHVELCAGERGLQVVHCVLYPWPAYALPLLSLDVVAFGPRVTLCIADVCPVTEDLSLPPAYAAAVPPMQAPLEGAAGREVPEWGARIFSPLCVLIRPSDGGGEEDVAAFAEYVRTLLAFHLEQAAAAQPLDDEGAEAVREAQVRYCTEQLRNDKTRRILAASFGSEFANSYMEGLMFDVTSATALRAAQEEARVNT